MELQDINLDNIKLVIFDFDDTLAIHKNKDFAKNRWKWRKLCEFLF